MNQWNPSAKQREQVSYQVLVEGAHWEQSTTARIMNISKKPGKNNVAKKRDGVRAAKRIETLDNCGDVLTDAKAAAFSALAARAN